MSKCLSLHFVFCTQAELEDSFLPLASISPFPPPFSKTSIATTMPLYLIPFFSRFLHKSDRIVFAFLCPTDFSWQMPQVPAVAENVLK